MAKKPTVTTLQSGFNSTDVLNQNFEALRDGFDNTLSLDGSTPNAMEADLDLNGNNIIGASGLLINGTDYLADVTTAKAAALAAQAAAELAENNAETSEVNAEASETAAGLSATASATSASAAQTAQTAAELAETNAETAETNAAASAVTAASEATTATTKASEASVSAAAAAASEAGVDADRVAAQAAASAAATSETNAATSETNAATSETNAANIATSSASSATASANSATAASASENAASTSETNAAASAVTATSEAATATTQASNASTSASEAAVSAASIVGDVADAQSAATQSQAARDTANLHKLAAEAAATSATNTASALTGFDLDAIAETKAVTAVDVFVYDTSKDSDGGAWRKRTQGTSWYNETLNTATRGNRKEFPAVAVIVAEAAKVTIYDGDDPDLPMWMVFNANGASSSRSFWAAGFDVASVTGLGGKISFGIGEVSVGAGLGIADFLSDTLGRVGTTSDRGGVYSGVAGRNSDPTLSGSVVPIVNSVVNDVAMTVLPNAPIDAATGLPVPTIAVATDGGVSVIKDDGTVVDDTATAYSNNEAGYITFLNDKRLAFGTRNSNVYTRITDIPTSDNSSLKATDVIIWSKGSFLSTTAIDVQQATPSNRSGHTYNKQTGTLAFGTEGKGLSLVKPDYIGTSDDEHFAAHIDSTYNTGWMNGDIKLATLSDTDDTDAVGSELVTNGDFASDIASWTDVSTGTGSLAWNASGHMDLIAVGLSNRAKVYQGFSTVIGKTYTINYTLGGTANHDVLLGSTAQSSNIVGDAGGTNGTHSYTFVAISTTTYVTFSEAGTTTATVDDVSCRLADPDRSVNDNGLQVFGTVTKNPVATGSDLVGYGGFSTSNYLEQPYNSDLDFGTGDFCLMGWAKFTGTGVQFIAYRGTSTVSQTSFDCYIDTSYNMHFRTSTKTTTASSFFTPNSWAFVTCLRRNGVGYIYRNGELVSTNSDFAESVTVANAITRLGSRADYPSTYGSLALWRISATAPSAAQIAKIYNDEKVLFQENAKATLYGSSDAVTALAHDDATDLLHAGTSAGRSVFQGLRRVSNTTTAVGTAISASNGLVVEE